jgi:hypothetical protein
MDTWKVLSAAFAFNYFLINTNPTPPRLRVFIPLDEPHFLIYQLREFSSVEGRKGN